MAEAIVAAFVGLLTGSFLNVCIHRLPRDLSVVHPRSACPGCGALIGWYDNIPVLSWVFLWGRCRHCRAKIAFRYPLVEIVTAACFGIAVATFGAGLQALKTCLFAAIMIDLIFTDFEERILPDEFTLGGTAAGIAFAAVIPSANPLMGLLLPWRIEPVWVSVLESAATAAFLGAVLWLVGFLYSIVRRREGLGLGDVKMVACIGAFLGLSPALLSLLVGSLLGSIAGLAYIALTGRDAKSYELPFGSFLGIAATAVALLPPAAYVV